RPLPRRPVPYTTLFRSAAVGTAAGRRARPGRHVRTGGRRRPRRRPGGLDGAGAADGRAVLHPGGPAAAGAGRAGTVRGDGAGVRSEEHTSELQSRENLV